MGARIRREIDVQRGIDHRNVMPILDAGPHEKQPWFAMPIASATLEIAAQGHLDDWEVLSVIEDAAMGLASAHHSGHVHRDVTPRNVLLLTQGAGAERDARWVVSDWGLVRRPLGQTTSVLTGAVTGTPGFIAPELFDDPHGAASPASDVYSLGRVVAWLRADRPLPAWQADWPVASPAWARFVALTTQRNRQQRPQTMDDVAALLSEVRRILKTVRSGKERAS